MNKKALAIILSLAIFVSGVVLTAFGVSAGDMRMIGNNGGTVCSECIGIG